MDQQAGGARMERQCLGTNVATLYTTTARMVLHFLLAYETQRVKYRKAQKYQSTVFYVTTVLLL